MLVLSRRIGESLRIGPDITVTIEDIRGNQVSISIAAPRHVIIAREEVAQLPPTASHSKPPRHPI